MAELPPLSDTDLVSAVVKIDDKTIDDAIEIERIETIKHVGKIPYAVLTLRDGSIAEESFKLSESTSFAPGNAIEILVGYHGKDKTVFKGVIVKQTVRITRTRHCQLVVTCCDKAFAMTLTRKHAQFSGETEKATLVTLIEDYKLSADVAISGGKREQLVQYFASDWDYLLCRAEANGALVLVDDATVSVRPPSFGPPDVEFGFGVSLIEIDIEMDARTQYQGANARTWDASAQALSIAAATEPSWSGPGNLSGETLAKVFGSASC
ncbi:MAG: phage late control D family protein, partial [Hyphomicrobiales bacterium]|nr:phage late control D family protein [Hyphomicrobiales bacterium]